MLRSSLDLSHTIMSHILALEESLERSLENTDAMVSRLMATELNLGDTLPFETNEEIETFMRHDDGYKVYIYFLLFFFIN